MTRLLLLLTPAFAAPAFAQPLDSGMPMPSRSPALAWFQDDDDTTTSVETENDDARVEFTVSPRFRYSFDADIDGPSDEVSVSRAGFALGLGFPVAANARFRVGLDYEHSGYDFQSPNTLIAGTARPFRDIHTVTLSGTAFIRLDDDHTLIPSLFGRFSGENGADIDDAGTFGGSLTLSRRFSDDLTLGVGILASSRIEDDALVLPALTVDWRFAENWRLLVRGPGGEVLYRVNDRLSLGGGAAWESRRFRLDDDPVTASAVVEDSGVPIYGLLRYKVDDRFEFDLQAGVTVAQEFEVENRNGDAKRTFDVDPAAFIGARLTWRF